MCLFACFVFVLILFVWCVFCVCVGGGGIVVVVSGGGWLKTKLTASIQKKKTLLTECTVYLFAILDPCHAHTDKCFLLCFHKKQIVCHRLIKRHFCQTSARCILVS